MKSFSAIRDKIRLESEAAAPIVKLGNGTQVEVQSTTFKFETYVTDDDFKDYVTFTKPIETTDKPIQWWYIVLPIVIFVIVIFSVVFAILSHRRRKVFVMKEQEILEKKFAEVEDKGVKIPDELKKVKTRIIKDTDLRKSMQDYTNDSLR